MWKKIKRTYSYSIEQQRSYKDEDAATNGNGRMARNTLEKAILNQSKRLVADPDASLELLVVGNFELE